MYFIPYLRYRLLNRNKQHTSAGLDILNDFWLYVRERESTFLLHNVTNTTRSRLKRCVCVIIGKIVYDTRARWNHTEMGRTNRCRSLPERFCKQERDKS